MFIETWLSDYDLKKLCCPICPLDPKTRFCGYVGETACEIWEEKRKQFKLDRQRFLKDYDW